MRIKTKRNRFKNVGQTLVVCSHQASSVTARQKLQLSKTKDNRQVREEAGGAEQRRGEMETWKKRSQRQERCWGLGPSQSMLSVSEQGQTAVQAGAMFSQFLSTRNSTHSRVECHGFQMAINSSTRLL